MKNINLNAFPQIDSIHIFHDINDNIKNEMSLYPQTLARAKGSVSLSFYSCLEDERLYGNNKLALRETFIRASLAELVSMEDTLSRDLKSLNINLCAIKLNDTANPLLHIIRELRNLEIHLSSSILSNYEKDMYMKLRGDWEKITSEIWYISNLVSTDFLKLNNLKSKKIYDEKIFLRHTEEFIKSQKEYGISEIVLGAVEIYCEEIITHYK